MLCPSASRTIAFFQSDRLPSRPRNRFVLPLTTTVFTAFTVTRLMVSWWYRAKRPKELPVLEDGKGLLGPASGLHLVLAQAPKPTLADADGAKAMPDDQEKCLAAGASDYMAKPLDVDKLLSLVRVWMPR